MFEQNLVIERPRESRAEPPGKGGRPRLRNPHVEASRRAYRTALGDAGMTPALAMRMAGYESGQVLYDFLRGHVPQVSLDMTLRLACVLGTTPSVLLGWPGAADNGELKCLFEALQPGDVAAPLRLMLAREAARLLPKPEALAPLPVRHVLVEATPNAEWRHRQTRELPVEVLISPAQQALGVFGVLVHDGAERAYSKDTLLTCLPMRSFVAAKRTLRQFGHVLLRATPLEDPDAVRRSIRVFDGGNEASRLRGCGRDTRVPPITAPSPLGTESWTLGKIRYTVEAVVIAACTPET